MLLISLKKKIKFKKKIKYLDIIWKWIKKFCNEKTITQIYLILTLFLEGQRKNKQMILKAFNSAKDYLTHYSSCQKDSKIYFKDFYSL